MTATADFLTTQDAITEPVQATDGSRMMLRFLQRLVGCSLALAAAGLWISPGSTFEGGVLIYKLILSTTSIIAGLGLMHASARPAPPEIEIDVIRREVRLVRRSRRDGDKVLSRTAYGDLGRVDVDGANIMLWDHNMDLLAQIILHDREVRRGLIKGLREEGHFLDV